MITQEQVDRILRLDGNGLPFVSLYVPAEPGRTGRRAFMTRVASLLDLIRPLAEDRSLEHAARLSLREDIAKIEKSIEEEPHRPGAVAVFSCSGNGVYEELWLPRRTRERIVVNADPYVRPMLGVLDEYYRTCAVIVDKGTGQVWEHYLDEARELEAIRDRTLRKPNYAAGLAEDRVRNKADELSKRHYRRLIGELKQLFGTGSFDLLVVGGHPYEVPVFIEFLPRELRDRLVGSFTIDRETATPADIRQKVQELALDHAHQEQRRLVGEILEAKAARLPSAVGLDETLWAASLAAIRTLAADEEAVVPGVVCDQDGLLARSGKTCPLCGEPLREVPDIIDELTEAVIDDGGEVRHIGVETELRTHQAGALLRFELPPQPAAAG
ncbi:baeRF10 domain-containing protein [Streptomyces sp. NPDC000880]